MATYKITYILDKSYMKKGEIYIDNVLDEHDAVECGIFKYNLPEDICISRVDLICE